MQARAHSFACRLSVCQRDNGRLPLGNAAVPRCRRGTAICHPDKCRPREHRRRRRGPPEDSRCLWHIHLNLRNNLGAKLGGDYRTFLSEFIRAQIQISETVFRCEYEALQHHWAVVVPYSEDQLMPNIRYWVGLRFDGFMTGSISMQRGEGPNRFKQDILGSLPTSSTYTKRS